MEQRYIQADLADRIRSLRKKKGWTQEHMADILDVSKNTVCNYEKTPETIPLETLIKMARALGISLDELVYGSKADCRFCLYRKCAEKTSEAVEELKRHKNL